MNITKEVTIFMLKNGFPTHLNGYAYMKDCFFNSLENDTTPPNKILYVDISTKHKTDPGNVERCLGVIVEKTWKTLQAIGLFSSKPSLREFVTKCAEYIKLENARPKSAYDILFLPDYMFS